MTTAGDHADETDTVGDVAVLQLSSHDISKSRHPVPRSFPLLDQAIEAQRARLNIRPILGERVAIRLGEKHSTEWLSLPRETRRSLNILNIRRHIGRVMDGCVATCALTNDIQPDG